MAELIDPNDLMFKKFQPKTQNRFILTVDGIPSFMIKKAARPSLKFATITLDHINTKRKIQGSATWDPISLTLYDPIVPSAAQACMEWARLGYESVTGRAGYADFYKRDIQIKLLDPIGTVVELWDVKGAIINSANFQSLDYTGDDTMMIDLTLKFDNCVLQF